MGRLLACPFCRELFDRKETERCVQCDIPLVPMERLPPSQEALAEQHAEQNPPAYVPPEYRKLNLCFWRRGRGALLALAALGLALFFAPWATLTRADEVTLRGFDLARGNAGWLWGGAVGWFILLPLVASRRTVVGLRGIRVIAFTFAAMTLGEVIMLIALPPTEHAYLRYGVEYAWGLYGSGIVSAVALFVATRLGGSLDDLRDLPPDDVGWATGSGQLLH